jgi:tetratricopeptide (TPR) repeat protein
MALLRLNLIGDEAPTSPTYRDSMFELGKTSFYRGDLDSAIPYLEDALRVHPNAIQAAEAHYYLGRVYWQQADNMLDELTGDTLFNIRQSIESNARGCKDRAIWHFEQAETILTTRQQAMGLTTAEQLMYHNVQFKVSMILLQMRQYEQAIQRLNRAATMFLGTPEALDALLMMAYAQRMLDRETESETTLRQAEAILNQLEQNDLIDNAEEWRNAIRNQMPR